MDKGLEEEISALVKQNIVIATEEEVLEQAILVEKKVNEIEEICV